MNKNQAHILSLLSLYGGMSDINLPKLKEGKECL